MSPDEPEYLVALHDFKGRTEDELSLKKGDHVLVLENDNGFGDGWFIHTDSGAKMPTSAQGTPKHKPGGSSSSSTSTPLPTQQIHKLQKPQHQVQQTAEVFSFSNVHAWSPEMVEQYFLSKGYDPSVCACFQRHKITGAILLELDLAYLKEIDITSFGTRFEISKEIKQLNHLLRQSTSGPPSGSSNLPPPTPVSNTNSIIRDSVMSESQQSLFQQQQMSQQIYQQQLQPQQQHQLQQQQQQQHHHHQQQQQQQQQHQQQQQQQQQQHHYQQQQQHHHQQQQQQLMSPPSFKRQSVLRTAKDNETLNSYLSGAHKKDPSFDPNWTHPKKPDPLPSYTSQQQQKNNRRLSRNRSSTISTADQYFTSFKEESHEDLPALPLIPDEGNLPEKSPFTKRHSKSTSSLGAGEFNFAQNELPVPEKDNVPGSLDKELPEKDLPEKDLLEKDLPKKPMELTRTETNDSMDSNSGPKRSSTSATAKKKPMLRSSSSHSNLRSKSFTKQKTSAFQEGLNIVTPSEALKTASISGWMSKRGSVSVGTWKARFFTLHGTRLSYFTSFSDTKEKGLIDVTSYRVMAVGDTDDKFVGLYAASVGAGRFCFKVVPPGPSALKGVVFTMPKVHYFAVDTREEMRAWMTAIMKATIDRDDRQPVVSSCATPTVPLAKAQELQAVARAKEEEIRTKAMANSTGEGNGNGGLFGDQINSTWLNGFGEYDDGPVAPYAVSPASSRGSSTQFTSVPSATTNNTNDDNDIRHVTTKTAGLRVVTDLENV
ncbi:hypothetical protein DV454_004936 [Geotrichum candidum]|nr:hypothetical protein DV454_004936 [Geotrichum candidum]